MSTALTVVCACALFFLAFLLTTAGKSRRRKFISGGIGGLSLLFAVNLSAGITGLSVGLNAVSMPVAFLLGVPGVFALISGGIFL